MKYSCSRNKIDFPVPTLQPHSSQAQHKTRHVQRRKTATGCKLHSLSDECRTDFKEGSLVQEKHSQACLVSRDITQMTCYQVQQQHKAVYDTFEPGHSVIEIYQQTLNANVTTSVCKPPQKLGHPDKKKPTGVNKWLMYECRSQSTDLNDVLERPRENSYFKETHTKISKCGRDCVPNDTIL